MAANVNPRDVERFLKGVDYPAKKEDLIEHAEKQLEILPRVIALLHQLPDQTFERPTDISKAIGEVERKSKSAS